MQAPPAAGCASSASGRASEADHGRERFASGGKGEDRSQGKWRQRRVTSRSPWSLSSRPRINLRLLRAPRTTPHVRPKRSAPPRRRRKQPPNTQQRSPLHRRMPKRPPRNSPPRVMRQLPRSRPHKLNRKLRKRRSPTHRPRPTRWRRGMQPQVSPRSNWQDAQANAQAAVDAANPGTGRCAKRDRPTAGGERSSRGSRGPHQADIAAADQQRPTPPAPWPPPMRRQRRQRPRISRLPRRPRRRAISGIRRPQRNRPRTRPMRRPMRLLPTRSSLRTRRPRRWRIRRWMKRRVLPQFRRHKMPRQQQRTLQPLPPRQRPMPRPWPQQPTRPAHRRKRPPTRRRRLKRL